MTNFTKNKTVDRKLSVSIGIPAYNEEANIKNLLTVLLEQKQDNFELLEIIVVSDGSTDNTVKEAISVQNGIISIIDSAERKGQALRQNDILKKFKGDILVLLNADVLLKNEMFLSNMVKPFLTNTNVGIVSNVGTPIPARTFFEKIINFSVGMRLDITENYNNGDNIYMCHGHSRAFSRDFAKKIKWPSVVAEDAYSYLVCKEKGFEFYYQPDAEILYSSPSTLKDHLRQSVRFNHSQKDLNKFFHSKILKENYRIPKKILILKTLKYFLKNPVLFLSYISIYFSANFFSKFKKETSLLWEVSQSSKFLIR